MKSNITILLTLWDRSEYSKTWLEKNYCEEFEFIVADGSFGEENNEIFSHHSQKKNLNYIRFSPDTSVKKYLEKVNEAIQACKTEYILMMDNDDFLIKEAIIEMKDKLDINTDCGLCAGTVRYISEKKTYPDAKATSAQQYYLSVSKEDQFSLNGKSGLSALKHSLKPYICVWYSLFRKNLFQHIWALAKKENIEDIFMLEYFISQLALVNTTACAVNRTYLLRLTNPSTSTAQSYLNLDFQQKQRIVFDEKYRSDFFKLLQIVAEKTGTNKQQLKESYREFFFDFYYGQNFRQFAVNLVVTKLYHRINVISFKIETIICILNFIERKRRRR